jgi:hypothetical protein
LKVILKLLNSILKKNFKLPKQFVYSKIKRDCKDRKPGGRDVRMPARIWKEEV